MPCVAAVLVPTAGCGRTCAYALPAIWPASLVAALRLPLHPLDAGRLGDEHDWVGVSAEEEELPQHDRRATRYVADGGVHVADLGLPEVCTVEHTLADRRELELELERVLGLVRELELELERLRLPGRGMDCSFDFAPGYDTLHPGTTPEARLVGTGEGPALRRLLGQH
jgi:hypothetical protein